MSNSPVPHNLYKSAEPIRIFFVGQDSPCYRLPCATFSRVCSYRRRVAKRSARTSELLKVEGSEVLSPGSPCQLVISYKVVHQRGKSLPSGKIGQKLAIKWKKLAIKW